MTALKILGILLLVFLLLGFLRLGAAVSFGDGLRVRLRVGVLRLTVYPRKAGKKERKKPEKAAAKKLKKKRAAPKPTAGELLDLLQTAFAALGAAARRACHRVRLDPLALTLVFGGDDPADTARSFGAANALLYAVMPRLEEVFDVPAPSLRLRVDFDAQRTTAAGALGVSLRVCDLFAIAFTLILPLLKWSLRFRNAHRRDAPPKPAETSDNDTERQSA